MQSITNAKLPQSQRTERYRREALGMSLNPNTSQPSLHFIVSDVNSGTAWESKAAPCPPKVQWAIVTEFLEVVRGNGGEAPLPPPHPKNEVLDLLLHSGTALPSGQSNHIFTNFSCNWLGPGHSAKCQFDVQHRLLLQINCRLFGFGRVELQLPKIRPISQACQVSLK